VKTQASRAGKQHSLIEGPIWKGLISFTIPLFLGNLFQQLYNTADTLIVGNLLGKEALAAVSSSGNLIFMMVGFLGGMSTGAGVLISKYFGAGDKKRMRVAIHTNLMFGLIAGAILTVVGMLLTPHILRWMGTPPNILPNSIAYFRTYFMGGIGLVLYNISTGILQAVGDSRHPLYYLIIASCTNVVLDVLFVGVFHWGVASAAAATAISQTFSAVLCIAQLLRQKTDWQVNLRELQLDLPSLKLIVKFGFPAGIQNSVIALANVVVQANINAFGDSAMAACGVYSKIEGFVFLPVTCFSMGLATFVGQNLGAKQYDRVRKGARFGIFCSMAIAEFFGILILLFVPKLIALFNTDPEVIAIGVQRAHVEALFYFLLALNHGYAGVFRGAGKAIVPMLVMMIGWCALRVTIISIFIPILETIAVIFASYPITWTVGAIVFTIYYFKADWIHNFDRLETKGQR